MKLYVQKNIRALRFKKGQTQECLAKKLGVNRQNIRSWEEGKCEPSLKNILRISQYFKIDIKRLLTKDIFKQY